MRQSVRAALWPLCGLLAVPAVAEPAGGPDLVFTLGGGAKVQPEYFGSDDYRLGPTGSFRLDYARLGARSFGSPVPGAAPTGFGIGGSFRYIRAREADDHDELAGLDDIDPALELGVSLNYRAPSFEAFADLRYGVVGHESLVGELGADLVARPEDRLELSIGPRLFFGSDGYADSYFGVDPDEAAASRLSAHEAGGGLLSAGIELGARYRINDSWGIEGSVSWDRLQNDAADSPITEQGADEQFGARIGLTRRFNLEF
jgi:outer membrane scaffolding protein for murein synthesis (MipA/OmpV family)